MRLKLITPPTAEPISLEEAKSHLRVDGADENVLIGNLIKTARIYFESWTGRALITQTWEMTLDSVSGDIQIPKPPLQTVMKIETIAADGIKTEFTASNYWVEAPENLPGRIRLRDGKTWPDHRGFASIIVTFKVGYGDAAVAVLESIKQIILQIIGHFHESRQGEEVPKGIEELMWPYKVFWLS